MTTDMVLNQVLAANGRHGEMNMDGVSVAFDVLREELDTFAAALNRRGALCFNESDYNGVDEMRRQGRDLAEFRRKVDDLRTEWIEWRHASGDDQTAVGSPASGSSDDKGPWTGLRVTFPDGRVVQERRAKDTFIRVLEMLGLREVAGLSEILAGRPMISSEAGGRYPQEYRDGYWISYHCSTEEKSRKLKVIARKIGVGLQVDII